MWEKSKDEEAFYARMFQLADVDKTGKVEGKTAVEFFTKSGLPATILKQVWSLASTNMQPYLNQDEFNVALGLIALAQRGDLLDLDRLAALGKSRALPLPVLQVDGANSKDFVMSATDEDKYKSLFRDAVGGDVHGTISPSAAMELFQKSGMPVSQLQEIYHLVDSGKNSGLHVASFTIAMHLIVCKTRRGMAQLPSTIPMELFPTLALPPIVLDQVSAGQGAAAMLDRQLGAQRQLLDAVTRVPASSPSSLEVHLSAVEALGYALPPSARQAAADSASLSELEAVLLRYIAQVTQELLVLQQQDKTAPVVPVQTLLQTLTNLKQQSTRLVEQKEAALRRQSQPQHPNLHIDVDKPTTSAFSSSFDTSFDNAATASSFGWDAQDPFTPKQPPVASAAPTFVAADDGLSLFSPTPTHHSFSFDGSAGTGGSSSAKQDQLGAFQTSVKQPSPPVAFDAFASATTSTFNALDAMNEMDLSVADKYIAASGAESVVPDAPVPRTGADFKRSTSSSSDKASLSRTTSTAAVPPTSSKAPPSLSTTGRTPSSSSNDFAAVAPPPVASFGAFDAGFDTAASGGRGGVGDFAEPSAPASSDSLFPAFGQFDAPTGEASFAAFGDAPAFNAMAEFGSFGDAASNSSGFDAAFSSSFDSGSVASSDPTSDFGKFDASFAAFSITDAPATTTADGFGAAFPATSADSDGFGSFPADLSDAAAFAPPTDAAANDGFSSGFGDFNAAPAFTESFGDFHVPPYEPVDVNACAAPNTFDPAANASSALETSDRELGSSHDGTSAAAAASFGGFSNEFGEFDGASGSRTDPVSFGASFQAPSLDQTTSDTSFAATSLGSEPVAPASFDSIPADAGSSDPFGQNDAAPSQFSSFHEESAPREAVTTPEQVPAASDVPEKDAAPVSDAPLTDDEAVAAAGCGCLFGLPNDDAPLDDVGATTRSLNFASTDPQTTAPPAPVADKPGPTTPDDFDVAAFGSFPVPAAEPARTPSFTAPPDAFSATVVAADTTFAFPSFDVSKPAVPPSTKATADDIFGDFTFSTDFDRRVASDPFITSFSDKAAFPTSFATEPANVADADNSFADFAAFQSSVGTAAWDFPSFPAASPAVPKPSQSADDFTF